MTALALLALASTVGITAPGLTAGGAGTSGIGLNEILADPPPDLAGDANRDGVRNSSDDEFVELINRGPAPVDLAGWSLRDSVEVRHVFPDSVPLVLSPGELATVFGGGTPTGFSGLVFTASSGRLSLNNGGDLVELLAPGGSTQDSHAYGAEGGRDLSLVRLPDGTGEWHLAGDLGSQAPHSAHLLNGGAAAPQASTWGQLKVGLAGGPGR